MGVDELLIKFPTSPLWIFQIVNALVFTVTFCEVLGAEVEEASGIKLQVPPLQLSVQTYPTETGVNRKS